MLDPDYESSCLASQRFLENKCKWFTQNLMTWSLPAPVTLPHLLPLHESYLSLVVADPAGWDPLSNLRD